VPELEDAKNAKVKFANKVGIRQVVSTKKNTNNCGTRLYGVFYE
jgi:hypothetical protein